MIVNINVTNDHINRGVGGSGCPSLNCMVGLAVKDVLNDYLSNSVMVTDETLQINYDLYYLNDNVQDKIAEFDEYKMSNIEDERPTPFSFELDIPADYLRMPIPHFHNNELVHK